MKDKLILAKNVVTTHIYDHRAKYAAGATLVVTVWAFHKMDRVSKWNEFLAEKGLTDEFYLVEEDIAAS